MEHYGEPLTVRHVLNSLTQIEIWIKAVRLALATLNPDQVLDVSSAQLRQWTEEPYSPIRTTRECREAE